MTMRNRFGLGGMVLAVALLPASALAQSSEPPAPAAPKSTAASGMTRGHAMIAGAVIGGVAGVYLGEEVLGQRGDFPHGWDMLVGGGIGATVGALIARSFVKPRPGPAKPRRSVAIVPVVSASRKAVFVTIPLK